jgi:hypothetical protein
MVKEWAKQETSKKQAASRWYSLILKMEAICSSETLVNFSHTTQHYIPEDRTLLNHHCENFNLNVLSFHLLFKILKLIVYKTIIFSVCWEGWGVGVWFLTLWEKHELWVDENKVLRQIFGSRKDEDSGQWVVCNVELDNLYRSASILRSVKSRRLWWADEVARMEEAINSFRCY